MGTAIDLTTFDFRTGKVNSALLRKNRKKNQSDYNRGSRSDSTLVSPIRQTASIFKQPVTVMRSQESTVRQEVKHGQQEKPRQLFWEKRLENLRFRTAETEGEETDILSNLFKPVGPNVKAETALQVNILSLLTISDECQCQGNWEVQFLRMRNIRISQPLSQIYKIYLNTI